MNTLFSFPPLPFILCFSSSSAILCPDPCRLLHPGICAAWLPAGYRQREVGRWKETSRTSFHSPFLLHFASRVAVQSTTTAPTERPLFHGTRSHWLPETLFPPLAPLGVRLITVSHIVGSRLSPHRFWFLQLCPHLSKPFVLVSLGCYNNTP